ncbi:MAG: hypothetical protein ABJB74_22980 [Gemmatimonas sp.]
MLTVERPAEALAVNSPPGFLFPPNVRPVFGRNAAETMAIAAMPAMTAEWRLREVRIAREGERSAAVGAVFSPREISGFVMVPILE